MIFQQNNRYSSLFSSFPAWSQTCFTTSKNRSEASDIWIRFNDFRLYYLNSSNVHNKIQRSRRGTMVLCFCVCCILIRMKNPHKTKYSVLWRHNRYQFNIWNAQIFKSIILCGFSDFFAIFFVSLFGWTLAKCDCCRLNGAHVWTFHSMNSIRLCHFLRENINTICTIKIWKIKWHSTNGNKNTRKCYSAWNRT